jgi:hypothetical protein
VSWKESSMSDYRLSRARLFRCRPREGA